MKTSRSEGLTLFLPAPPVLSTRGIAGLSFYSDSQPDRPEEVYEHSCMKDTPPPPTPRRGPLWACRSELRNQLLLHVDNLTRGRGRSLRSLPKSLPRGKGERLSALFGDLRSRLCETTFKGCLRCLCLPAGFTLNVEFPRHMSAPGRLRPPRDTCRGK